MTSSKAPQPSWLDEIPARLADIERAAALVGAGALSRKKLA